MAGHAWLPVDEDELAGQNIVHLLHRRREVHLLQHGPVRGLFNYIDDNVLINQLLASLKVGHEVDMRQKPTVLWTCLCRQLLAELFGQSSGRINWYLHWYFLLMLYVKCFFSFTASTLAVVYDVFYLKPVRRRRFCKKGRILNCGNWNKRIKRDFLLYFFSAVKF